MKKSRKARALQSLTPGKGVPRVFCFFSSGGAGVSKPGFPELMDMEMGFEG